MGEGDAVTECPCPTAGEIAEALVLACPAARVTMRERVVRGSYRTVVRAAVTDATPEADNLRDLRYRWSPWVEGYIDTKARGFAIRWDV